MALHPEFADSPYLPLVPEQRWFPADEACGPRPTRDCFRRSSRRSVRRSANGARRDMPARRRPRSLYCATGLKRSTWSTPTRHPFSLPLLLRPARGGRDGHLAVRRPAAPATSSTCLRFDASGAVSSGMFDEDWPRYVVKMATGAGKTKVLSLLIAWSFFHQLYEPDSTLARNFLRHRAQHHRARPPARRFRRAADLLQRSGAAATTATTGATGATTSRSPCTSRTTSASCAPTGKSF